MGPAGFLRVAVVHVQVVYSFQSDWLSRVRILTSSEPCAGLRVLRRCLGCFCASLGLSGICASVQVGDMGSRVGSGRLEQAILEASSSLVLCVNS